MASHYLSANPEGSIPGCADTWTGVDEFVALSRNLEARTAGGNFQVSGNCRRFVD
jgi:hypothetical protein